MRSLYVSSKLRESIDLLGAGFSLSDSKSNLEYLRRLSLICSLLSLRTGLGTPYFVKIE